MKELGIGILFENANDFYYGSSQIYGAETQLGQDTAAVEDLYGKSDTYVAMVPRGDLAVEQELSTALHEIPQVKSILSYVDTVDAEIPMGDMAFAEGGEIFSSGSEDMKGTEGLEYEYIEETDSCRVVKGVDQKQVDIPAYYEGKPL